MPRKTNKVSQLADAQSWRDAPYAASNEFLAECERLKMWPGDSFEQWEWFYIGWLARERAGSGG